jgi:hypothetical protein
MNANEPLEAELSGDSGVAEGEVPRSSAQRFAEDEDLRESLEGLARLATNRLPLEDLLTRVATYRCGHRFLRD